MNTLKQIASQVGDLVRHKRELYGDSIDSSAAILRVLFPGGVPVARLDDVLLVARVCDKLQRLATFTGEGDSEDPWLDIAGYGICGVSQHQQAREKKDGCQGSVSGPHAQNSSKATPASAAPPTRTPTTPNAKEPAAQPPLQPPASWSPQPMDATASTVEANASASAAVPASDESRQSKRLNITQNFYHWLDRNRYGACGACSGELPLREAWFLEMGRSRVLFCSPECATFVQPLWVNK